LVARSGKKRPPINFCNLSLIFLYQQRSSVMFVETVVVGKGGVCFDEYLERIRIELKLQSLGKACVRKEITVVNCAGCSLKVEALAGGQVG